MMNVCNNIISIITPLYNSEKFIAETITSVLNQTYSGWELLIIDDCSNDRSADIVNEFRVKDNRIKYFRTEYASGSPTVPRNIGISLATGRYIAFLDSDDLWNFEKLLKQLELFSSADVAIVYSDYEKINEESLSTDRIILAPEQVSYENLLTGNVIACSTCIYYTEKVKKFFFKVVNPLPFKLNRYSYSSESKKNVSLGKLTYQKGYDLMLNDWSKIEYKYPDWSLHIYGKEEDYEGLLGLKKKLNIKQLTFEGLCLDTNVAHKDPSFYIMSSRFEGFSMVLIEAQAFSLPLIYFNCPHGPSEIIDEENGILVENEEIIVLSEATSNLIEDSKLRLRMSHFALKSAEKYSIKKGFQ